MTKAEINGMREFCLDCANSDNDFDYIANEATPLELLAYVKREIGSLELLKETTDYIEEL
jgi:hypothetical protein